MELDQAATSGLVQGLQLGVEVLWLCDGVRLHLQTLVEYDGRGSCGEVSMRCEDDTADTYREGGTWAERINWNVATIDGDVVMWRPDD